MECPNEDAQKNNMMLAVDPQVGTLKSLLAPNFSTSSTSFMNTVLIL